MNEAEEILSETPGKETPTEPTTPDEGSRLVARIEKLEAELADAKADVLRAMAETQTVRRRGIDEVKRLRETAAEKLITELLPVLDNFERTLEHLDSGTSVEKLTGGIQAVERQLRAVLENQGLKRIQSVGGPFDPEIHDALGTDPATEETPVDTVTFEFEPAYRMGEKVIRHARVKVAKEA